MLIIAGGKGKGALFASFVAPLVLDELMLLVFKSLKGFGDFLARWPFISCTPRSLLHIGLQACCWSVKFGVHIDFHSFLFPVSPGVVPRGEGHSRPHHCGFVYVT